MSTKKSYNRYFIILQEDEKGHSISADKQTSGYAKVETKNDKCKISYYVQNIKKDKSSKCYMVLICNKKDCKKLINLGPLNIDESGRADVTYECSIDNIGGTSIGMDKIGGAAIVKIVSEKTVYILSGFASSDVPDGWKNYPLIEGNKEEKIENKPKDEKKEVKPDSEKKEKTSPSIFEQYEKSIDEAKNNKVTSESGNKEEYNTEEDDEVLESQSDEYGDDELAEQEKNNEMASVDNDRLNGSVDHSKYYKDKIEKSGDVQAKEQERVESEKISKGTVGDFFLNAMEGFEEVNDICPEIPKCKWFKISAKDLEFGGNMANYNKYTIAYYPMMNYYPYMMKYGHYMIGLMCNEKGTLKYLVYAIPGTQDRYEQPFGGKTGFVTWVPAQVDQGKESYMGYWTMFYDFKNSIIVVPMK